MQIKRFEDKQQMAKVAAEEAASVLRKPSRRTGRRASSPRPAPRNLSFSKRSPACPVSTGQQVEMFHLDEYIGIPDTHPASFCRFLKERLIQKTGITKHHLLSGDQDPDEVIRSRRSAASAPIDVAFVGIGENGHLAFNDPPADFETEEPYWSWISMKPAAVNKWAKVVRHARRCAPKRYFNERPPDSEGEKDHLHCAGCSEGQRGESMLRRSKFGRGARLNFAETRRYQRLPGQGLGGFVEARIRWRKMHLRRRAEAGLQFRRKRNQLELL